jgi:replication initiation and membrane attachment protein DnaB
MTKKKKDYSKEILERIVGTKSKATLAAFAEKYGIKREEMKKGIVDKIYNNKEKVER